jgi:hypothetical protein
MADQAYTETADKSKFLTLFLLNWWEQNYKSK